MNESTWRCSAGNNKKNTLDTPIEQILRKK
jgi:hypothetical protein